MSESIYHVCAEHIVATARIDIVNDTMFPILESFSQERRPGTCLLGAFKAPQYALIKVVVGVEELPVQVLQFMGNLIVKNMARQHISPRSDVKLYLRMIKGISML